MRRFFAVMCLLFFFCTVGVLLMTIDVGEQTEEDTEEFTATVSEIRTTDMGNEGYIDIFTDEYDTSLYISAKLSKEADISDLTKGDKIVFRVEDSKASMLGQVAFVDIVSLANEHKTYISLSDYNAHTQAAMVPVRISAIVFAIVFLTLALILIKKNKH